jgi:hypothetical protein
MVFKISNFMVGLVVISAFVGTFALFFSDANSLYSVNYDNETMKSLDKLDEVRKISQEIEKSHKDDESDKGLTDVLGNLIADGINIGRLAATSYTSLLDIMNDAADKLNIPSIWTAAGFVIIIILVFVGFILRIKVNAEV